VVWGRGGPNCPVEACDIHTIARTCYIFVVSRSRVVRCVHCDNIDARLVCYAGGSWDGSVASCIRGLGSPGFCSGMSFFSLFI
jgi:hypothetical protein